MNLSKPISHNLHFTCLGMRGNEVKSNLPTFQEAYRNANKAYKFVIYDAGEALDQVVAGSEASELLISRYLIWCQKELNSLRSEIESGMYKNCQTYGLLEIENSLQKLVDAFNKQEEKHKSKSHVGYHNAMNDNHQSLNNGDMLVDNYSSMSIE